MSDGTGPDPAPGAPVIAQTTDGPGQRRWYSRLWGQRVSLWNVFSRRIGLWLISIIATLLLPCLPLAIEWLRKGHFENDTISITQAVLAATLIFTSEHPLNLGIYILLFVPGLLINAVTGQAPHPELANMPAYLLGATCGLHAGERFWWHVVSSRPFPDRVRFKATSDTGDQR